MSNSSSLTIEAGNPSNLIPTEVDNGPTEEATIPTGNQLAIESSQATVASTSRSLLPVMDCLPIDSGVPSPLKAISSAEGALRDASEVIRTMNLCDTWRDTCRNIKRVMDVVTPITEVRTLSIVAT